MKFIISILCLVFMTRISIADEYSLQKQLNIQKEIIDAQSKRIDELETFVLDFKKNLSELIARKII